MDRLILLSLSLLAGVHLSLAFPELSRLSPRKIRTIIDDFLVQRGLALRVKKNQYPSNTRIFIPHMLTRWPWSRRINPYFAVVKQEADAWMASLRAFTPKAQDAFNRCDFRKSPCLSGVPKSQKGFVVSGHNSDKALNGPLEHARAGCELMDLFFMFDEYSDRSTPSEVRMQKDVIIDALRNPHTPRPKGEWIGGELSRQFWERASRNATAFSQKRFIQTMDEYLESVVQESIDKHDDRILDIKDYIDARRRTSGAKPSFSIIELGLDIPEEVMAHPAIQDMILAAIDLIAFSNDIISYNLEQQRGDDFRNMITSVMNEHHTDVNGAILWCESFLLRAEERFLAALAALPQWQEPLNSHVKEYCDGLGYWVRANYEWSFESERYFGKKGLEIKEKRWMFLLPKKRATEVGAVHVESSLL